MTVIRRVKATDYVEKDLADSKAESAADQDLESVLVQSGPDFKEGTLVNGKVIKIDRDEVIVDIGFKSGGLIPISEFAEESETLKIGDNVEVMLESLENENGELVLSKYRARKIRVWDQIMEKYEKGETVEGQITDRIKGGLSVNIGLTAFLPGSQIDLRPVKNLDKMIGETHQFSIIKMSKKRGNIVLSRRALLEEERRTSREQAISNIEVGKMVSGVVKNIADYGAFIDLGGIDGLLHITDISWGRVRHPSEMFSVGDDVEVMVLNFDKERERISLGLKQTQKDPWIDAAEKFPPASRVKGKVVSVADYGAFIELSEGIEGLVHISEMSWNKNIHHPNKIVSIGDEVDAVVLSIDSEKKRISLGMKQIQENPWDRIREKYPIGSVVEGRVRNLVDFGAFVELEDGIDGLVHIFDMSWTNKVKHPSEVVRKRDLIKTMVLAVDKDNERVSLGIKQLERDPWEKVELKYKVGDDLKCVVTKVANFGVFAEIEDGVEGLIHVSQLSTSKIANPRKSIKVGQEVTAKIIKFDAENRKVALSIRAFLEGYTPEDIEKEVSSMETDILSEEDSSSSSLTEQSE